MYSMNINDIKFKCDLQKCHSLCCQGSIGAPLYKGEADIIHSLIPLLDLPEENMEVCKHWTDNRHTPIINKGCAFLSGTGIDRHCAIQEAYHKGLTDFVKPISCHLFPLRISPNGHISFECRES